ncbi:Hypothetical protein A7982_02768 [Minicystis rosea]|nr:Hypothetical protein A7982_02768 [Minicystis rosea]
MEPPSVAARDADCSTYEQSFVRARPWLSEWATDKHYFTDRCVN